MKNTSFYPTGGRCPQLIEEAAQHICTAAAIEDSGSALARLNLMVGMAKILHVQSRLGYPRDACFVATPDLTPTRGQAKWAWGLSAGGVLSWGNGERPLVFLDLNVSVGCTLVGGVERPVDSHALIDRVARTREGLPVLMGVPCKWDYDSGNHFINVYETGEDAGVSLPPYIFMIHGSGRELKPPTALGKGLDFQASRPLARSMTRVSTPLGPCHILEGQAALDFAESFRHYRQFTLTKQQWVAHQLFGEYVPVSAEIHHGLVDANRAVLGCYHFDAGDETLFPVTLRADLPAFLVKGRNNLDPGVIGLSQSHPAHLLPLIRSANVLPHGGGAMYPQISRIDTTIQSDGRRLFILKGTGNSQFVLADLHGLEYALRGLEVMDAVKKAGLGDIVATLRPLLSLTI